MANGNSNENVSVSMQPALVKRLEKYCFKHDLQKSQVISKAVRRIDKNLLFDVGSIRNVDLYVKKILTTKCGVLQR